MFQNKKKSLKIMENKFYEKNISGLRFEFQK